MASLWSSSDSELSDSHIRQNDNQIRPTSLDDPLKSEKPSKASVLLHDLLDDSPRNNGSSNLSSHTTPRGRMRNDVDYFDLYLAEREKRIHLETLVDKLNYRISELEELLDSNSSKPLPSQTVHDAERDKRQMERQRRHMANAKRSSRRSSAIKAEKRYGNRTNSSKSPTSDATPTVAESTIPQFEPLPTRHRANLWESDSSDWSSDDSVAEKDSARNDVNVSDAPIAEEFPLPQHPRPHASHTDSAIIEQRVNDAVLLWAKGKDILAMIKSLYVIYEGALPNIDYTLEYGSPNASSEIRRMYLYVTLVYKIF